MNQPNFDIAQAHKFFAADCFNRAWGLIDKPVRTAEEDREMLLLTLASLWHWTQREDCTSQNLSVGHWQASRVYSLLNDPQSAMYHAEKSLSYSHSEPVFYRAYAHEALARAAKLAEDKAKLNEHLEMGFELAKQVADSNEREALEKDLQSISEVKAKLAAGQIIDLKVTRVADFGVFFQYEQQELAVLIPDTSWIASFGTCQQFARVGDKFRVQVAYINYARGKVRASIKDIYPNPWEGDLLKVGTNLRVKVVRCVEEADRCNGKPAYLMEVFPGSYAMLCDGGTTMKLGQEVTVNIVDANPARYAVKIALV